MNYLHLKKRAFMKVVNTVKGMVRTASGIPPLMLEDCVDNDSLINYSLHGNSVQDGTPSPDTPVEIESVGELNNLFNLSNFNDLWAPANNMSKKKINDNSFELTSTTSSDTKTYRQATYNINIDEVVGKKLRFSADITNSAEYMITAVIMQWVIQTDAGSTALTNYPIDYYHYHSGIIAETKEPITIPDDRVIALRLVFCLARNSTIAVGDKVTFRNVKLYPVNEAYKIPVVARGKNLIPFPYDTPDGHVSNGITYTVNADGSVTAKGTATGISSFYLVRNKANLLKSGVTYTISGCTGSSGSTYEIRVQRQSDSLFYSTYKQPKFSFDEQLDTTTVSVVIVIRSGQVVDNLTFYPMIEAGTTATEFEPYVEPVTTNIYLAEPLRKVGEYADYIDFENQKVVRATGSIVFNGLESWQITGAADTDKYFYSPVVENSLYSSNTACLCDIATTAMISNNTTTQGCNLTWSRFRLRNANLLAECETVEEWKTWLTKNNINVIYPFSEGQEKAITLPQLPTIKGTTVYEIDTTTQPSQMGVTYYSNVKGD